VFEIFFEDMRTVLMKEHFMFLVYNILIGQPVDKINVSHISLDVGKNQHRS
jgi:hypothetical protein